MTVIPGPTGNLDTPVRLVVQMMGHHKQKQG